MTPNTVSMFIAPSIHICSHYNSYVKGAVGDNTNPILYGYGTSDHASRWGDGGLHFTGAHGHMGAWRMLLHTVQHHTYNAWEDAHTRTPAPAFTPSFMPPVSSCTQQFPRLIATHRSAPTPVGGRSGAAARLGRGLSSPPRLRPALHHQPHPRPPPLRECAWRRAPRGRGSREKWERHRGSQHAPRCCCCPYQQRITCGREGWPDPPSPHCRGSTHFRLGLIRGK